MYISPILGDIEDEVIDYFSMLAVNYSKSPDIVYRRMRSKYGYSKLRTGVLYLEMHYGFKITRTGKELVDLLFNVYGMGTGDSYSLIRLFAANQYLIDDLLELGYSESDVVYGIDMRNRITQLGLRSISVYRRYALESYITVHPILELEFPEPPPEYSVWHPFLAGVLITCDTWVQKKNRRQVRSIEARGKFEARRDAIIPDFNIEQAVFKVLEDYVLKIESDGAKSYESFLEECGSLTFEPPGGYPTSTELLGYDLLEEQDDFIVELSDEADRDTIVEVELWDVNYAKLRDTRVIHLKGIWWE